VANPQCVTGYGVKDRPDLYDLPCRMRRLAYDIECDNEGGRFPTAELNAVINIHAVGVEVRDEERIILDLALVLGSCDAVGKEGETRTVCFETERELLDAWADLQTEFDPDIITGYNSSNFDNRYILERAKVIGAGRVLETSRCYAAKVEGRVEERLSNNQGPSERFILKCEGRVYIDMLPYVQHNLYEKLRSYKLNDVAAEVLKDQKDDIDHMQIPILHRGTSADRKRLADYCRKDAFLAHRLMTTLMALVALFELSRVQRVQLDQQQNGGASFKVFAQLLFKFRARGFISPYRRQLVKHDYEGATVFEPARGYYNDTPIASLDFASLYPSIAIAYNACTTTHVLDQDVEGVLDLFGKGDAWRVAKEAADDAAVQAIEEDVFYVCPMKHRYVRAKYFQSVFGSMLQELLELRGVAKKMMETAVDSFKRKIYDQRQLSLKTSANSGYGFFGLVSNGVYWWWVSETITACGREQIGLTKCLVEEEYTIAKGYPGDARVIYGDTVGL
jgi:DNA polymerase delta subunit 1